MKMFFNARSAARNFNKASVNAIKVVDSKENPSAKGSRWAVVSPNRKY
jgi:hypothetical protein